MMLSIQQRYLLDVLKCLGCARREQLYRLAAGNSDLPGGGTKSNHVDAMLRQLRYCIGEVRLDGELVYYGRSSPDAQRLEAVDVMLELTDGKPMDFHLDQSEDLLLRFTLESEGGLRLFGVARYRVQRAHLLTALPVSRTERIIFLADKAELPYGLILPYKHFFALRQNNGTHRFFGGGDQ